MRKTIEKATDPCPSNKQWRLRQPTPLIEATELDEVICESLLTDLNNLADFSPSGPHPVTGHMIWHNSALPALC